MNAMALTKSKGLNFAIPGEILCKIYDLLKNNKSLSTYLPLDLLQTNS